VRHEHDRPFLPTGARRFEAAIEDQATVCELNGIRCSGGWRGKQGEYESDEAK
jgi:hypothetical protein